MKQFILSVLVVFTAPAFAQEGPHGQTYELLGRSDSGTGVAVVANDRLARENATVLTAALNRRVSFQAFGAAMGDGFQDVPSGTVVWPRAGGWYSAGGVSCSLSIEGQAVAFPAGNLTIHDIDFLVRRTTGPDSFQFGRLFLSFRMPNGNGSFLCRRDETRNPAPITLGELRAVFAGKLTFQLAP